MFDLRNKQKLRELHVLSKAMIVPPDPKALMISATLCIEREAFDKALAILCAAIIAQPELPRAWALAGYALEKLHRLEEAAFAYQNAIQHGDRDPTTAIEAAQLLVRLGELSRARALLGWAAACMPSGRLEVNAAYVLLAANAAPDEHGPA